MKRSQKVSKRANNKSLKETTIQTKQRDVEEGSGRRN